MTARSFIRMVLFAAVSLVAACAAPPQQESAPEPLALVFSPDLFGQRPEIAEVDDIFWLSEAQQGAFLTFFHDPARQSIGGHERIYDYLRQTTSDFDFHNDTRTASDTLTHGSGNCLSLAIVTTAYAQLVGVEIAYELVDATPIFERRGTVISKGVHVRSILYDPRWEPATPTSISIQRPGIRFDYFPTDTERTRLIGNLSNDAYIAMYYSNMASEAIAGDDLNSAYWHLIESLEQDPLNGTAMNMMAVTYRRAGDAVMAERIYDYAMANLPENVSLLRNYRSLLLRQGRHSEAQAVSQQLESSDDRNPFNWIQAGRNALDDGEFLESIGYFKEALEIAPYLHEAYALKAVAHLRMGDSRRGERELRQAIENAQRVRTRSLYEAKLATLPR